MKKTILLFATSVFCFSIFAQHHLIEKKLSYAVTSISMEDIGIINVTTPIDLLAKDIFSAGVRILPEGKKEKDISKNSQTLSGSIIYLGDNSFPASKGHSGPISFTDKEIKNLPLKITGANGKVLYQTIISDLFTSPLPSSAAFKIPTHALVGSPLRIIGPFDGNSENTKCNIGGKPAEILAESPRQCIVEFPDDVKGPTTITIEETGTAITQNIGAVDLSVTAGNMDLRRGENTQIDISVNGLQNLPASALLTVTNTTPNIVTMAGGNMQAIAIQPTATTNVGTFYQQFNVQSVQTGNFSINVNLDLPQPPIVSPTELSWCSCNVGTVTIITRQKYCDDLKRSVDQKLAENNFNGNNPPINNVFPNTLEQTVSEDQLQIQLSNNGSQSFEQVIFTYQKITPGSSGEPISFDLDSTAQDGFQTFRPIPQLDQGVYNIGAIGFYGNNQRVSYSSLIVVPAKSQTPTVTNNEIDSLKRKEKEFRDSINNINNRIKNAEKKIEQNNNRLQYLDSVLQQEYNQVNELTLIDATIESIPGTFSEDLLILIDSLKNFKAKVGNLSPAQLQQALDDLDDKIKDLEDALKACQDHLAALEQEEKDLADEKAQVEKDQQQAFRDIMQQLKDAGYDYAGFSGRDRNTGQFNYGYGVVLRGSSGEASYYKGAVPAQAAAAIGALNKKINALNQRHNEIGERQKQIPKEKEDAQKECDRLSAELNKAKEAREKGAADLAENNAIAAELQNIYNQIADLLKPLKDWCEENPGNNALEQKVKSLLEALAKNPEDYQNILKQLEDLIQQKKKIENEHRTKIEKIQIEMNGLDEENQKLQDGIEKDQQNGEGYGGGLGNTLGAIGQAIENEQAARKAEEAAAAAERKKVCLEFMTFITKEEPNTSMIALLAAINEQISNIGGVLSNGLGAASELTTDETKLKIEKIKEGLDKILGPLKAIDELKEQVQEILDIKEKLETLLSSDDTPEARAQKLGALMGLMSKVLNKVAEEFPLLKFFTAYFSYLVEGYNAAVSGIYKAIGTRYKDIVEDAMSKVNCETLINEYMKNKSMEDVYRKAYKLCGGNFYGTGRSAENRRVFQEEVNKAALKKMMECCIRWSS